MIQVHVYYSGAVQGVGFRYTARHYAIEESLCGWVRNLPNGGVELLVEGEKDAVDHLLQQIEGHFEGYIAGRDIHYGASQGSYKGFMIIS